MSFLLAVSIALQLFNHGVDLYYQGRYREAIAAFTEAVQKDPYLWKAYRERARAEEKLQMYNEALADVNEYLSHYSDDQTALYLRVRLYLKLKMYNEALKDTEKLLEIAPDEPYYIYSKALIKESLGDLKEAAELFEKASRKFLDENLKKISKVKGYVDRWAYVLSSSEKQDERINALQNIYQVLQGENPVYVAPAIPFIVKSFFYGDGMEWFLAKTLLIEYSRRFPVDRRWVWYLMDQEYRSWERGKKKKEKKRMLKELKNIFSLMGRRAIVKKK